MFLQTVENVMIDLETLGTSGDCVIMSIGACGYNKDGYLMQFYQDVSIADCLEYGLQVDASTITWWLGQGDCARSAIVEGQKTAVSLAEALKNLASWFRVNFTDKCKVWSNGASFDIPIVAGAYRRLGLDCPWKFWNERCFRTIKAMFRDVKSPVEQTAHNALEDAMNQLQHLNLILKAMAEGT